MVRRSQNNGPSPDASSDGGGEKSVYAMGAAQVAELVDRWTASGNSPELAQEMERRHGLSLSTLRLFQRERPRLELAIHMPEWDIWYRGKHANLPVIASPESRSMRLSHSPDSGSSLPREIVVDDGVPATVQEIHSAAAAVVSARKANGTAPPKQPQEAEATAEPAGVPANTAKNAESKRRGVERKRRIEKQAAERREQQLVACVAVMRFMERHSLTAKVACVMLRVNFIAFRNRREKWEGQEVNEEIVEAYINRNLDRERLQEFLTERERQKAEDEQEKHEQEMRDWGLFLAIQQLRQTHKLTIPNASRRCGITSSKFSYLFERFSDRGEPPFEAVEQRNRYIAAAGYIPPDEAPVSDADSPGVFAFIRRHGTDEDFAIDPTGIDADEFVPTDAPPGSREKVEVLAERVMRGFPLWHPQDREGYEPPNPECVKSGTLALMRRVLSGRDGSAA